MRISLRIRGKKKKKKRFDDDYLYLKSSRSGSPFPHPPQDGREEGCVFRPPTKATQVKEKKVCVG